MNPDSQNDPSNKATISNEDKNGISFLDLLILVAENLRLLILTPIAAGLLTLTITYLIQPTYTAEARFLPPQQQQGMAANMLQSLGAIGGLAGAASGLKNPADLYIAFLKSTTVEDALIDRFKLLNRYDQKYRQDARKVLENYSRISGGKDGLITIAVEDKDPQVAASIANTYIEELGHLLNRLAVTEAQQRRAFFEKQMAETENRLTSAQQALAASGVSLSALNTNPIIALEGPARLRAQITALEIRLASTKSYLTNNTPEVRQIQIELEALRSELTKSEKEQPTTVDSNSYIAKFREFKYQETLFELFSKQFEIAKIDESKEGAIIQIVDSATPPERKSKPRRGIIAIATSVATGLILLTLILAHHTLKQTIASGDRLAIRKISKLKSTIRGIINRH
ncbi:Wzz/FepE/Etk N-terminal domain-containing protein [Paracidovorax wautersii]|uniref:Capsule polysaccharide export protein KpsE/RkpR n=1 Tax=Paracidovorax wautersii TaxID=1177982 RepID=A0A1I2CLW3_9BURK|nr:Wzz/FepE/Etk N-terminal domain-containing protein [Paracidovorax wautersii]SFE68720.1 Capsule polysaccharide export protein KpsE/RkpR [Paracidovorax wautersii]